MKKTILLAVLAFFAATARADEFSRIRPVQFGIGVGAGTNGVSVDAVLGLKRFIQVRGGYSFVPRHNMSFDADVYNDANNFINIWNMANPSTPIPTIDSQTCIALHPHLDAAHLLLDLYPSGSFHFTVGAYFGREDVVNITNAEDGALHHAALANTFINAYNELYPDAMVMPIGMQWGNYVFTPDASGNLDVTARVRRVRPYFGIGFGRAVPRKSRVGCSLDIGVQYWGKPTYFSGDTELLPYDADSKLYDLKSKPWFRAASTSPVYPTVTFRLCGRLF